MSFFCKHGRMSEVPYAVNTLNMWKCTVISVILIFCYVQRGPWALHRFSLASSLKITCSFACILLHSHSKMVFLTLAVLTHEHLKNYTLSIVLLRRSCTAFLFDFAS